MWLTIILLSVLCTLLYIFSKSPQDFWRAYGMRQINIASITDNLQVFLGRKTVSDLDDKIYWMLAANGEKFCGIVEMLRPLVIIKDLEIVKKVLIKDFDHFPERRGTVGGQSQPIFKKMIGNLKGEEWKGVRTAMSPAFSTGKIRRMMGYFNKIGREWVDHLKDKMGQNGSDNMVFSVEQEITSYTTDVVAATAYGMDAGMIQNPNSKFAEMCRRITATPLIGVAKFIFAIYFPRMADWMRVKHFDEEAVDYFDKILSQGITARLEGTMENGNDFLQLVAEAQKGKLHCEAEELGAFERDAQIFRSDTKRNWLSDDATAKAQMVGFLFAGFSTTSNLIGFSLYCLALHPQVQDTLRAEVDRELFGERDNEDTELDIDFDKLNTLVYLEMVICEVLRKYGSVSRLQRKCVRDYYDPESGLRVPEGAFVGVSVTSIHNDPTYYEQPDKFYPEHFTPEKKAERNSYAYLPFGSGPRNCIGMRFALVKSKAAIAHLVHHFYIETTPKTPVPLAVQPVGFGVNLPNNLELKLRKRV